MKIIKEKSPGSSSGLKRSMSRGLPSGGWVAGVWQWGSGRPRLRALQQLQLSLGLQQLRMKSRCVAGGLRKSQKGALGIHQ